MTNSIHIATTPERARRLRSLLDTVDVQAVGGIETPATHGNDGSVVVRLLEHIEADSIEQVPAEILVLNGRTWQGTGQTMQVRSVTGEPIGTEGRKVARRVGRYGWVVEDPCPRVQCKMRQDLLAAVDSWTDPSVATAHVYVKYDDTNDMKWSGRTITIVNRFENISVDAGTYCKAEWIDGEWQLYAADCPGGSASIVPSASASASGSIAPEPSVGGGP